MMGRDEIRDRELDIAKLDGEIEQEESMMRACQRRLQGLRYHRNALQRALREDAPTFQYIPVHNRETEIIVASTP